LDRICEALKVDQARIYRGTCRIAHVGRGISAPINPRNKVASGQLAANASLIRVVVSLIHTAIFSNRSRMVENSPLTFQEGNFVWCAFPERENPTQPGPLHLGYTPAVSGGPAHRPPSGLHHKPAMAA